MMKKVLAALLAIIIVFSFCACGKDLSDNGFSDGDSYSSNVNNIPLNAQNFISLLKESDGFVYGLRNGSFVAEYFEEGNTKYKGVRISDYDTLSLDYDRLAGADEWYFEVYNDSHFSTYTYWGTRTYSYSLAYSDPENRYVIFVDDDYEEGDEFELFYDSFTCMTKEAMKLVIKGMSAFSDSPSTVEGSIRFINDCLSAAN